MSLLGAAAIAAGAGLLGGILSNKSSSKVAKNDIKMQEEFAKHGIGWKVADAKAAGLHPLAALGANTISYSPQRVGKSYDFIGSTGQNVARALTTQSTAKENEFLQAQIDHMKAQTDSVRLQQLSSAQKLFFDQTPKMPPDNWEFISGQADVKKTPKEQIPASTTGVEVGASPTEQKFTLQDGSIIYAPGQAASEPMESSHTTQGDYTSYKLGQGVDNWSSWYSNKPNKTMLSQWRDLMKNNPPKKGYVWRSKKGRWFQIPASKATRNSLFAPQWINSRRNLRPSKKKKWKKRNRKPKWFEQKRLMFERR